MKQIWQDILIALSLSNLLFIISWRRLVYPETFDYNIKHLPQSYDFLSIILMVSAVAAGLVTFRYLANRILPKSASVITRLGILFLLICIANGIRMVFPKIQLWLMQTAGTRNLVLFFGIFGLLMLFALFKYWEKSFEIIRKIILAASPFVLITFANAGVGFVNAYAASPTASEQKGDGDSDISKMAKSDLGRVVWIIFDALDYKTLFENRPEDINLPNFDKFRKASFNSVNATAPNYQTLFSIPSLITGKKVISANPVSKNEMILRFEDDSQTYRFSESPTLFKRITDIGGHSSVVGWYHPYCRLFQNSLSECHWESFDFVNDFESESLFQSVSRDAVSLIITVPLLVRYVKTLEVDLYIARHNRMIEAAKRISSNPQTNIAFIHLAVPHRPYRFNRKTLDFAATGNYFDSLVLADRALGKIRNEMERRRIWNDSVVIISSDHQWRLNQLEFDLDEEERKVSGEQEDPRVPFMVKLRDQNAGYEYDKAFNTLISHELILEMALGDISDTEQLEERIRELKTGQK